MKMSVLVEKAGQDWRVSLVPPQVARVLSEYGSRTAGVTGGAVVLVAGRSPVRCDMFTPEIRIELHEPDG